MGGGLWGFALGMDAADGGGQAMVHIRIKNRKTFQTFAVGNVGRKLVKSGTGTLADEVNNQVWLQDLTDMVAGPYPAIADDDVMPTIGELCSVK